MSCQACVAYTTFVRNTVLSFTTSDLIYLMLPIACSRKSTDVITLPLDHCQTFCRFKKFEHNFRAPDRPLQHIIHWPVHDVPFPVNPDLHLQPKLPSVLLHTACVWQLCVPLVHSFTSVQTTRRGEWNRYCKPRNSHKLTNLIDWRFWRFVSY